MISIFLNEEANKKAAIFESIVRLPSGSYSLSYLIPLVNLSKPTIVSYMVEINQEVKEVYGFELLDDEDRIYWKKRSINSYEYYLYLAKQSLPYRLILYAFNHPDKSLEDFCQLNYLSASSARRLLTPLVVFLKKFNIKLRLSNLSFEGHEFEIRNLFYSFFWMSSQGSEIIEKEDDLTEELTLLEKLGILKNDYINTNEVLVSLLVAKKRLLAKHSIAYFLLDDLPISEDEARCMEEYLAKYLKNPAHLPYELSALNYAIFYSIFALDKHDIRTRKSLEYFHLLEQKETEMIQLIQEFFQVLEPDLVKQDLTVLYANTFNIFLKFFMNKRLTLNMTEFRTNYDHLVPTKSNVAIKITTYVNRISRRKDFAWLEACADSFILFLIYIVTPYSKSKAAKLQVGIPPLPDHSTLVELTELLSLFSFVECHYRKNIDESIDLQISTFKKHIPDPSKPYILVNMPNLSAEERLELFSLLYEEYKKRYPL